MAKITIGQVKKFNAACKNGFMLDLEHLGIWGKKKMQEKL